MGRVVPLLPQRPFIDGINCCRHSHGEDDIQAAFEDALRVQVRMFMKHVIAKAPRWHAIQGCS